MPWFKPRGGEGRDFNEGDERGGVGRNLKTFMFGSK
jgi:hypothetical protein